MRVLLRVAYDGTAYCGWQVQPNAVTVEGKLTDCVRDLFGADIQLIGASRTDSGVHAMGNVAVFDVETRMPAEKVSYALNSKLPWDIRIQESIEVPAEFHPRHTDCVKMYEYQIYNDHFENPKYRLYTHFDYGEFNLDAMRDAAKEIEGTHDFSAFCAAATQVEDKHRTVYSVEVLQDGKVITIRVIGNGFLYNMVRIIAGTLMKVGKGQMTREDVRAALEGCNRFQAGPTAPAKGLTLMKIWYPELGEELPEVAR